jgi:hypothetical protein
MGKKNKKGASTAYKPATQHVSFKPIHKKEIPSHVSSKAAKLLEQVETKKGPDVFKKEL